MCNSHVIRYLVKVDWTDNIVNKYVNSKRDSV